MEKVIEKCSILGFRHVQVLLLFFGYFVGAMIRLNVSIAVVAMTNAKTSNPDFPEYDWNGSQKQYIMSSIYWGFIIAQLLGAMICRKFGCKITFATSMFVSSLLSLITPLLIPFGGWQIYCCIRFVEGLFQGVFFPSVFEHISKWAPVHERTRLGSISYSGILIGTISTVIVSGIIAKSSLGWPGISYVFGGTGLIWTLLWLIFADDSPSNSKFISSTEKDYILSSQNGGSEKRRSQRIPWKRILTSTPCWSLMILGITQVWSYSSMVAELPLFVHGVLELDIRNNAIVSGLPFLAMFLMNFVYLIVMEFIIVKNVVSSMTVRKVINSIATWIPAGIIFCIGFIDKTQRTLIIVLLITSIALIGGQGVATGFNAIDLAPNYTVIIMGLIYTVMSCAPVLIPLVTGYFVKDETNPEQWRIVFIIASVLLFLGNLQFLFFGTDQEQPWNNEDFSKTPDPCETGEGQKGERSSDIKKNTSQGF